MESRALRLVDARFTVDLHPVLTDNPCRGFEEHLSTLLLRYNDDFDGVVVAYDRAHVLGRVGVMGPFFPYARVHAQARLTIFAPLPGALLGATVNEVGPDFVAALALGFVNVTIDAPRIRGDFAPPRAGFDGVSSGAWDLAYGDGDGDGDGGGTGDGYGGASTSSRAWVSRSDPTHALQFGTRIWFRVRRVAHQGQFMHILGSLEDSRTGAASHVRAPAEEGDGKASGRGARGKGEAHERSRGKGEARERVSEKGRGRGHSHGETEQLGADGAQARRARGLGGEAAPGAHREVKKEEGMGGGRAIKAEGEKKKKTKKRSSEEDENASRKKKRHA